MSLTDLFSALSAPILVFIYHLINPVSLETLRKWANDYDWELDVLSNNEIQKEKVKEIICDRVAKFSLACNAIAGFIPTIFSIIISAIFILKNTQNNFWWLVIFLLAISLPIIRVFLILMKRDIHELGMHHVQKFLKKEGDNYKEITYIDSVNRMSLLINLMLIILVLAVFAFTNNYLTI